MDYADTALVDFRPSPFQIHNDDILNHLYNAFQTGVRTWHITRSLNVLTTLRHSELRRHLSGEPLEFAFEVLYLSLCRLRSTYTSMLIDYMPSSSRGRLFWLT